MKRHFTRYEVEEILARACAARDRAEETLDFVRERRGYWETKHERWHARPSTNAPVRAKPWPARQMR